MPTDVTNEVFSCGEFRDPEGEGKKDKTTVRRAIETMLPTKNLANHNSLASGFGLKLGEDIIIFLLEMLVEYLYLLTN